MELRHIHCFEYATEVTITTADGKKDRVCGPTIKAYSWKDAQRKIDKMAMRNPDLITAEIVGVKEDRLIRYGNKLIAVSLAGEIKRFAESN